MVCVKKLTTLAMLLCGSALLAGCGTRLTTDCDWTRTIYIGSDQTVEWLLAHDEQLLRSVIAHNEIRAGLCQ